MKAKVVLALLLVSILYLNVPAEQFMAGKGMFYTQSSLVNDPGQMNFKLYLRAYRKAVGNDQINNAASCLTINLGISEKAELGIAQILYQDVHFGKKGEKLGESNSPGNTLFSLKVGRFFLGSENLSVSFEGVVDYRTGDYYNIYLEPYYNYGITGQIHGLLSYYFDPYALEETSSLHLNLGYINHNDQESISESAQTLALSAAFLKSTLRLEYGLELYSRFFIKEPLWWAYSRENFAYITPSFKYKFENGVSLGVGLDLLAFIQDEQSDSISAVSDDYPQMSAWRFNLRLDYDFPKLLWGDGGYGRTPRRGRGLQTLSPRRTVTDQQSLFEWVVDENQGAQYIDLELEKIREERKRAEEELKRLKAEIEKTEQKERGKTGY